MIAGFSPDTLVLAAVIVPIVGALVIPFFTPTRTCANP